MQSSNASVSISENKTSVVSEFTSLKTYDIASAWKKGTAFGFHDCEIWFGVKIETSDNPEFGFTKHPLNDRYVRLVEQSKGVMDRQKRQIEVKFSADIQQIEFLDKINFSSIINKIIVYDGYINKIAGAIPESQSVSDYIFSSFDNDKKRLKIEEDLPGFLLWIADKLEKNYESIGNGSLILLIATWIEVSNAVAWNIASRKAEKGKPYFCWEDVISSIDISKAHNIKPSCSMTGKATKSGSDNKVKSIRKRKLSDQKETKVNNKIKYRGLKNKSNPASGSGHIEHHSVEALPAKRRRVVVKSFDGKKMEQKCDNQLSKLLQKAKEFTEETNKLFLLARCSKVDENMKRDLIDEFLNSTCNINALKTRESTQSATGSAGIEAENASVFRG